MTSVIHLRNVPPGWKKDDPDFVFIGAPAPAKWGNPFHLTDFGRDESILRFTTWFRERLATEPGLWLELRELRGKTLVCFCTPKPCHGDVMARMMEYPPISPGTEGQMALRVPYDGPGLEYVPDPMRRKEIAAIQHAAWLKGSLDLTTSGQCMVLPIANWRMKVAGLWEEWGAKGVEGCRLLSRL